MQWAAAGAANCAPLALARPVFAQGSPPPAPVTLTKPDFDGLANDAPRYIARVRPHRTGGVNLKPEGPLTSSSGPKYIVHNYGHSGAGITLSWGCAMEACKHVGQIAPATGPTATPPPVAILGVGVIGLTVASELRRKWPNIQLTFYAKDFDLTDTTSYNAGGQFGPSQVYEEYGPPTKAVLLGYLQGSINRLNGFSSQELTKYGIKPAISNYALYCERDLDFGNLLPKTTVKLNLNGGVFTAERYTTWLVNPTILLPQLLAELSDVKQVPKKFTSKQDVLNSVQESIIVNCTGYGAKAIFGDTNLVPRRGHLVMLKNPAGLSDFFSGGCDASPPTLAAGSCTKASIVGYVFERQRDIVVGGTVFSPKADLDPNSEEYKAFERDSFDPTPGSLDSKIPPLLIRNAKAMFAGAGCTQVPYPPGHA
jgi:FAD dependent oxidoreductase